MSKRTNLRTAPAVRRRSVLMATAAAVALVGLPIGPAWADQDVASPNGGSAAVGGPERSRGEDLARGPQGSARIPRRESVARVPYTAPTPLPAVARDALPRDPNVVAGGATFAEDGSRLDVTQSTDRVVIDWRSFDIGQGSEVNFFQPGTTSIAVNRISEGGLPSQIQGILRANGTVVILNPNGVIFSATSRVDVGGLVASTGRMDVGQFMAGSNRLEFTGATSGEILMGGSINIADAGLAAFVAPHVRNDGVINARLGRVALASGETFTLDLAGDRLIELGLGSSSPLVENFGSILVDGGRVQLSAVAAGAVVDQVINAGGLISVASARAEGGTIVLEGANGGVTVSGELNASGATGGGDITLGGANIQTTAGSLLRADAVDAGDGGSIVAIADGKGSYAGALSARGGANGGDGGFIETSGKTVSLDAGLRVDTTAVNGVNGSWSIDPEDLVIGAGEAAAVVASLSTTNVVLQAQNSITIDSLINSSAQSNANTLSLNDEGGVAGLTVNLNAAIRLGVNQRLLGQATQVNVRNGGVIQNAVDVALANAGILISAGDYVGGTIINKNGLTLTGEAGARIVMPETPELNGVTIAADNVTVQGLEIVGPASAQSYLTYGWSGITRGIFAMNGADNFTIANNNIHGVRTGILVDGRNAGGSITGNIIDNTKSGISVQYTDAGLLNAEGFAVNIAGNSQGPFGNEWGFNFHLNGHQTPGGLVGNAVKIAPTASMAVQQALLAVSAANGGMSAQDQGYNFSNRTSVNVGVGGNDANQGSALGQLATIQAGINAVVTGGRVNVGAGTFVQPTGSPAYLWVNKSVEIAGAGQGLTIIDARGASTYGIRVQADNVNLHDFTLWGVAAPGNTYGIKVEPLQTGPSDPNARLFNFALSNVTIQGSGKTELDLNGVIGATIANVTANGMAVGGSTITAGNGISITDSANITLTGVTTLNNGWGGLALYQTNRTFNQQVDNISVDASNTFNEANGIYLEDQSDGGGLSVVGGVGLDYGALSIAGYDYIVNDRSNPADIYTWFQRDQASAFNWLGLTGRAATGSIEGWNGVGGNNVFSVGVIGGTAMSINSAIRAARNGAIINVGAGTYGQALDIDKSLSILGAGAGLTIIQPTALLATGVGHKYDANMNVSVFVHGASNVILDGLTIDGNNLAGNAGVFWSNASGELRNSHITNVRPFSGLQTGHGLAVDATAGNTTNLLVSNVLFDNWNKNAIDAVTSQGATNNGGTINLTIQGSTFTGRGATGTIAQNGVVLWERGGGVVNGTINNSTFSNIEYTGSNATASGLLVYGSPNGQTSVHGTSFSGVQTYLALDGGTLNELNATGNVFDGVAADTATLAQLFAIEDRISHGVDLAGAGLIRIKAGQVFVTTGAGSGAINRGLALASTGNTVNVAAGTYADTVQISRGVTLAGAGIGQTNLTGGILMSGSFSDLTLRGFTVTGNAGGNFVVQGGQITNLTVDGVRIDAQNVTGRHGFGSGQYGGAISITNSQFANIDGWVVFDTRSGAGAGGGTQIASGVFSNNIIDNSNGSIAFRQQTGAFAYPNIVIANNTVTNVGASTNSFGGVFKVFNGNTVDFTGNSVSDVGTSGFNPAGEAAYGAVLITRDVQQLNIIGNTFTNNNQVLAIEPGRGLSTNTFLAGNTFTNNRYGIYMPNNALAGGAVTFGAGNNFIAGANTLQHIVWRSAAGLDLTGVAFNGKLGSAMSLAELFDVEDLISHGTDVAGRGLARVKAGQVFVTTGSASVQRGINVASTGDTVHVEAGTYTLPGELSITRSVSLVGAGVGGTIFNSQSAGYGIFAAADNVTLSGFTFNGNPTGSYGIKVQPNSGAAGARVHDFAITNVAINGTRRTGLDLNGVVGAVIDGVTVTGSIAGNGISITDSADVTVRNTTTSGNAWGGLALYQANRFYNQQVSDIVVEASNVFGEVRGLYTQDESALFGFGSLTLLGFDFTVRNDVFQADAAGYTFYKATLQDALNYGVALGAAGSYVQGWDGSQGDNHFYVGAGNAGAGQQFLSIQTAFDKSSTGSLIDIASGAYGGVATLAGQRDLRFGVVELGGLNLTSGAAGTIISGDVTATGGLDFDGAIVLGGDTRLAAAGDISLIGVDGQHALAVEGQGQVYVGQAGASVALASLSVLGSDIVLRGATTTGGQSFAGDTVLLWGGFDAGGNVIVSGPATLGGDTVIDSDGDIQLGSVDGEYNLSLNATGAVDVGAIGAAEALNGLNVLGAAITSHGATTQAAQSWNATTVGLSGAYAAGGDITVNGAANLNGSTSLTSDDYVALGSVDGAHDLTVEAANSVSVGQIGGTTALVDLVIEAGQITAAGARTTGSQMFSGARVGLSGAFIAGGDFTVDGDTDLNGDVVIDGDDVTLASVDGAHDLSVDADGAVSLGAVGSTTALASLDVSGVSIASNGAETTGDQSFQAASIGLSGGYLAGGDFTADGATNLTGDVAIDGDDVTLASVNGAHDLSVDADGAVSLGAVGSTTALASLDVSGASIASNGAATTGSQTFQAASIGLSGGYMAGGDFTADGATNLTGDVAIDGDDVTLASVNGAHDLSVDADGAVSLGAIGGTTALASLDVSGASITSNGAETTGDQSFQAASIGLSGGYMAGGDFTADGATNLTGDASIEADDVSLESVDGAHDLSVDADGAVTLGAVGGTTALASLDVSGASIASNGAATTGDQTFQAALIGLSGAYAAGGDFTADGAANLTGDVAIDGDEISLASVDGAHDLSIDADGAVSLGAVGGNTALASLDVSGASIASQGAATTGDQTFQAALVGLSGAYAAGGDFTADGAANLTGDVAIDGDDVSLASIDGAHDLSIDADGAVSLGAVGSTTALASLDVSGSSIASNGAETTGSQTFRAASIGLSGGYMAGGDFTADGATNLTGDASIEADDVTLESVDGGHDLSVEADGAVSLGAVGGTTALVSLDVSGASIASNGAATTGDQSFQAASIGLSGGYMAGGDFTVDGATNLTGDVAIDGDDVTLASVDGAHDLSVDADGAASLGAVGGMTALASLDVSGASIASNGAATTGDQTFQAASIGLSGAYAAGGDFTADGATNLTGDVAIDGDDVSLASVDGAHDLSVDADGAVSLGAVGSTTALASLDVSGASIASNGAETTGDQTFQAASIGLSGGYMAGGDFTADGATNLTGEASLDADGNVVLGTINGAHSLSVGAAGSASFGAVGGTTALANLDVTAATIMSQGAVTSGDQSYDAATIGLTGLYAAGDDLVVDGAAILNGATSIDADSVVMGTIDGAHDLSVEADGAVSLGGIGATTALTGLDVSGASIAARGARTVGAQSWTGEAIRLAGGFVTDNGDFTLTGRTTLDGGTTIATHGGDVVAGTVDGTGAGGQSLSIDTGAGTASLGSMGEGVRLGAVLVRSAGTVLTGSTYAGSSLSFLGSDAGSTVRLTRAVTTFNSSGPAAGDIVVQPDLIGTVNGAQSVVFNAGSGLGAADGDIILGNLGSEALRLGAMTVSGDDFSAQTVKLAGNFVSQLSGDQVFSANTLDTLGDVNAKVGGNDSGPLIAGGSVSLATAGTSSGSIAAGGPVSVIAGGAVNHNIASAGSVAVASTGGSVTGGIQSGGAVSVNAQGAINTNVTTTGAVAVASTGGSVTGTVQGGGAVSVTAQGAINTNVTTTGTVAVASTGGSVTGTVQGGGAVSVTAQGAINTNVTTTGTVAVASTGGSVTGTVQGGAGVTITAQGPISANVSTPGAVTVVSPLPVNVNVTAGSVAVNAPGGRIEGTFGSITTDPNGTINVNGQQVVGSGSTDARQILIDKFLAPAGGLVGSNGQIRLPVNLAVALIAPAGEGRGNRRPVVVNSIDRLGELLRLGYTAIIIQLDSGEDYEQEIDLAAGAETQPVG